MLQCCFALQMATWQCLSVALSPGQGCWLKELLVVSPQLYVVALKLALVPLLLQEAPGRSWWLLHRV